MHYVIPLFLALSCQETEKAPTQELGSKQESISLEKAWEVRFTDNTLRAPYEGSVGWQHYYKREYKQSLPLFNGEALARLHLELSALNRQALLMHSYSIKYAYGDYKQEGDGPEVSYLQGVAACFLGEFEEAKSFLSKETNNVDLKPRAEQWLAWLNTDRSVEPTLQDFFFSAEGGSAKSFPNWEKTVHYSFASTAGSNDMEASEGTALWLQAKWHEEQASVLLKEAGQPKELAALFLAPWRLPFEKGIQHELPSTDLKLGDDWLFFNFILVPQDAYFLASLNEKPKENLEYWKNKSILAAMLAKCMQRTT